MTYTLSFALLGSLLLWFERNDQSEKVLGFKLGSGFWTGCILVLGAVLIREHHVELWKFALSLGLFAFTITAPHNLLLKPPQVQITTEPRDLIQTGLFKVFGKEPGNILGVPACIVFDLVRYVLPVSGMGLVLGSDALIIAGPICALIMWPWVDGDWWKVHRSTLFGGVFIGALAV